MVLLKLNDSVKNYTFHKYKREVIGFMLNARGEGEGKGEEEEEEEGRGREGEGRGRRRRRRLRLMSSIYVRILGILFWADPGGSPRPPLCMKTWVDLKVKVTQQRWANGRHIATSWDRQNMYGDRALGL